MDAVPADRKLNSKASKEVKKPRTRKEKPYKDGFDLAVRRGGVKSLIHPIYKKKNIFSHLLPPQSLLLILKLL